MDHSIRYGFVKIVGLKRGEANSEGCSVAHRFINMGGTEVSAKEGVGLLAVRRG